MLEITLMLIGVTALLLGSPGPAPMALAATGATYGFKKGVPFLIGILAGLTVAMVAVASGLAILFNTVPQVSSLLQIVSGAYFVYVAYKIATAPTTLDNQNIEAPGFYSGFILNLLNPKAYAAFLAIFSQYLLPFEQIFLSYLLTAFTCLLVATVVDFSWLMFGCVLKPIFSKPKQARAIRVVFAVLMLLAVIIGFV